MKSLKVDYAFADGRLRLTGISPSAQKAPASDPITPGSGFWLTVEDRKGRQTHAQILRDPRTGAGGEIPDQPSWAYVPDPGKDGFVAFHMGLAPVDTEDGGGPTAVFPLRDGSGEGLSVFQKLLKVFKRPKPAVWLLILSDGFAAHETAKFLDFADELTRRLCDLEPFNEFKGLKSKIVAKAGPTTPGGGFGWKITGLTGRLLMKVDTARVMAFVAGLGVDPVNILVVINDERYGGSGGDPAVTGLGSPLIEHDRHNAIDAAIHELGHSAFALADEYDLRTSGYSTTPVELNVAHDAASVRAKWGALLDPADGDLPTLKSKETVTAVGMFKGAKYDPDNNYRSQLNCRMRSVEQPFCAACRQVIESVLACEL